MKRGPNQPKKRALVVLSCLKMGIYKTGVSKELKIRIEKIQDNLSNVKGRPQDRHFRVKRNGVKSLFLN